MDTATWLFVKIRKNPTPSFVNNLLENCTDKQKKKITEHFYDTNGRPMIIEQKPSMTTYGGFVYLNQEYVAQEI